MAEPFFPPLVRVIANVFVFPFSKSGDVKVYTQKKLKRFLEVAGFKNVESFVKGKVLFISAEK